MSASKEDVFGHHQQGQQQFKALVNTQTAKAVHFHG